MSATIGDRRKTVQKGAVTRALETASGFTSAGELHHELNAKGTAVGLATVYRQLNVLLEDGRADTINVDGRQLFRACEVGNHHHHLVCESCGVAVEVDPPSEDWIGAAAARNGFTVTRHVVEVFGRCVACRA